MADFPLTWVVVADGARGRLFEWTAANGGLREVLDLINPEGRLHRSELASDRPGFAFSSHGDQSRHPMQPAHSARDNAADAFAREVAAELNSALDQGTYERLVLIAPPGFLGVLRAKLDDRVGKKVVESLALDLTRNTPEEIKARLPRLSSLAQSG